MLSKLKTDSNIIQEKINRREEKVYPFLEELKKLEKIHRDIISDIEYNFGPKWETNPKYLVNKKKEELAISNDNILSVHRKINAIPDEISKICKLRIRTLTREVFYLIKCEELSNLQIIELKKNVAIDTGIPILQQRYILNSKQLRDNQKISDLINPENLRDEITIYLVLRLHETSKYCEIMIKRHIGEGTKIISLNDLKYLIKEAENMSMTKNSILNCLLEKQILVNVDNNTDPIQADHVDIYLKYLKYKLKYLTLKKYL
jgi:hypothetical protein